jgi:hypothetical protein
MAKDLIRLTEIVPNAQEDALKGQARTEVDEAASALMKRMLFGAAEPQSSVPDRPRIILALDATTSMGEYLPARKITLEAASDIAAGLFAKAGSAGLQVRLAYFRGDDQFPKQPRQLRFSNKWYGSAEDLARAIAGIEHRPGWTQHCRLLREVIEEVEKCAVQEIVVISDAFEQRTALRPQGDDLPAALVHAKRLRDLGVTLSFGFRGIIRGGCPLDRAGVSAKEAFHAIADANGGAVFLFDPAQRSGEIAERAMRVVKGDAIGAQLLLEHLRTVEFDFVVGEQVHVKCGAEGETNDR